MARPHSWTSPTSHPRRGFKPGALPRAEEAPEADMPDKPQVGRAHPEVTYDDGSVEKATSVTPCEPLSPPARRPLLALHDRELDAVRASVVAGQVGGREGQSVAARPERAAA